MPEDVRVVGVRSNVSALSSARLHQALKDMVERVVDDSTTFMRAIEPKRTGELEAHTIHTHAEDVVDLIEAKLGVTAIGESVPSIGSDSSHYPIFVDVGTGIFGDTGSRIFAHTAKRMHFEIDGHEIFAESVAGQRGQHFVAATEAFAQALLRTDPHIRLALDEMAAEAAAMSLEERA